MNLEGVAENIEVNAVSQYLATTPLMDMRVPGLHPVTIGCRDFSGRKQRFSWHGKVPVLHDPPAYAVSSADWLTLTQKLGLARHLEDRTKG